MAADEKWTPEADQNPTTTPDASLQDTIETMRAQAQELLERAERDRKFAQSVLKSIEAYQKG